MSKKDVMKTVVIFAVMLGLFSGAWAKKKETKFFDKVRYIITTEEKKAYELLETDDEKAAFEKDFWDRRGPAFKAEFEKRYEEANFKFRGEGKDGWLTDRGRIYILLGPPDKVDNEGDQSEGFTGRGSRTYSKEIWTYFSLPASFKLPPHTKFEFVEDINSRYQLRSSVDFSNNNSVRGLDSGPTMDSVTPVEVKTASLAESGLAEAQGAEVFAPVISEEELDTRKKDMEIKEILYSDEVFDDISFIKEIYQFKTTDVSKTDVMLNVGVKKSDLKTVDGNYDVSVFAMFRRKEPAVPAETSDETAAEDDKEAPVYEYILPGFEENAKNKSAGTDDILLFQNSWPLAVDEWELKIAVKDNNAGKIGLVTEKIKVADFGIMPSVSTIVLAREITDVKEGKSLPEGEFKAFHIVDKYVEPNLGHRVVRGIDGVNLYFQVYNEETSAGKYKLKFYNMRTTMYVKRDIDKQFQMIPSSDAMKTNLNSNVHMIKISAEELAPFPLGEYQFRYIVYDTEDKTKKHEESVYFTLTE